MNAVHAVGDVPILCGLCLTHHPSALLWHPCAVSGPFCTCHAPMLVLLVTASHGRLWPH